MEIQEHARPMIAGYEVPKSVESRGKPLPPFAAMKVLEHELRRPQQEGKR